MYVRTGLADGVLGQRGRAREATQGASTPLPLSQGRCLGAGGVTLQSRGVCSLPPFRGHTFWNRAKDLCLLTLWEAVGGTPGGAGGLKVGGPPPALGPPCLSHCVSGCGQQSGGAGLWMEFPNQIISPG